MELYSGISLNEVLVCLVVDNSGVKYTRWLLSKDVQITPYVTWETNPRLAGHTPERKATILSDAYTEWRYIGPLTSIELLPDEYPELYI